MRKSGRTSCSVPVPWQGPQAQSEGHIDNHNARPPAPRAWLCPAPSLAQRSLEKPREGHSLPKDPLHSPESLSCCIWPPTSACLPPPWLQPHWCPTFRLACWKYGSAFAHQAWGQSQWKEKHQAQLPGTAPALQQPAAQTQAQDSGLWGRCPQILLSCQRGLQK